MKSTLEKCYQQKKLRSETLVRVRPGTYMILHMNKMKRVFKEAQGLLVGSRIEGDNHKVVLIDEELILVPEN